MIVIWLFSPVKSVSSGKFDLRKLKFFTIVARHTNICSMTKDSPVHIRLPETKKELLENWNYSFSGFSVVPDKNKNININSTNHNKFRGI